MMLKRSILAIGLVILILQPLQVGAADAIDAAFAPAIQSLSEARVIDPTDQLARSRMLLSRAEALKTLLLAQGSFASELDQTRRFLPPLPLFTDLDQRSWYAPFVEVAFRHGIVTGFPDGTLRPGQPLRVAEAVTLLVRTFGDAERFYQTSPYLQNQPGQWYTESFNAAIKNNLVMHAFALHPTQGVTRGQFFDMVYRMREVRLKNLSAFTGFEPTIDIRAVRAVTAPTDSSGVAEPPPIVLSEQDKQAMRQYASAKAFALSIPSLGIRDLSVIHPADPFTSQGVLAVLKQGVGHLFAYPGAGGKVMIYGHSSGYPWDVSEFTKIFRGINKVKVGDVVYVTYQKKLYVYQVTKKRTVPAKDRSFVSGSGEELILYTCWPPDSITQRYLVHGMLVGTVAL